MIDRAPLIRAERFVDSCAAGPEEAKLSRYAYTPDNTPKLALSAAGLLTRQYLGCRKDNNDLEAGCKYLMQNLPPMSGSLGAIYYFHYATQVTCKSSSPARVESRSVSVFDRTDGCPPCCHRL